jgi:serine protease inhibitor
MPSFNIEFEKELNEILPEIGFSSGFSKVAANFGQISKTYRYRIKNVIHKAKIEVSILTINSSTCIFR